MRILSLSTHSFSLSSLIPKILFCAGILVVFGYLLTTDATADSGEVIALTAMEDGSKTTGSRGIWQDPSKNKTLNDAVAAYAAGEFSPLQSAGSSGLKEGAFWTYTQLQNTTDSPITVNLEYVDHQLIALEAYAKSTTESNFQQVADLMLESPYTERPIRHNRFVFALTFEPGEVKELYMKLSAEDMGFFFPSLRIWTPNELKRFHDKENNALSFLFGGFFAMSICALIAGITTKEKVFLAYSIYALSKLAVWGTVFGYTQQYVITDHYNWSYMSITGALTILFGIVFARLSLKTRRYTRKLDYLLLFMIANSIFLLLAGIFRLNTLAVISITLALLLYPFLTVISIVRWRQGSTEGLIFAVAWSVLILGLVVQALRDLGLVTHNFFNYYWPPIASFTEMSTIMIAIGVRVNRLNLEKQQAERNYREHMERTQAQLEELVKERTKELAEAIRHAEVEAHTDALTGVHNRRSFLKQAESLTSLAKRKRLSLHMLMLDIDHFKSINDTYGHNMGDAALMAFSKTLSASVRDNDVFGRVGGEEFALLINENAEGSIELAERIREEIEQIQIEAANPPLKLTVSIGIARFEENDSVESLMKKADTALYQAKKNGRNCVVELISKATSDAGK